MKISLVQDFLRSGGTERQTILLANAFAAAGHAASVITFRPGGALAATLAPEVKRLTLQPFDLGLDWFAPGLVARLRRLAPDVVVSMGRMANCHAGRIQRALPGTSTLATMRTGKPLPALFRRSLATVRHIVANSQDARDTLVRDYTVPAAKIAVIPNSLVFPPAAHAHAPAARHALRAQEGATASTCVLLCVAMFRPEKNQRELVEIAAGLPTGTDWQLWLAGDGPARAACEQRAAALGLASRIRFLGFQRNPAALYSAADLAVHASWSEALSNFLIEAQAHGLPCIAYRAQGVDECYVPGRTGWTIERDDRDAFRRRILEVIALPPAARAHLSAAAAQHARDTFDHDRNVQRYLDLFTRLRHSR